jgi:hypothetical protein
MNSPFWDLFPGGGTFAMNNQRGSSLAFLAAAAWLPTAPYFWEFLREFIVYEQASKLFHMAIDGIPADTLVRFVPSLVLTVIGFLLFLQGRAQLLPERATLVGEADRASAVPAKDDQQWFSSYRVLKLADPGARASPREDLYEKLRTGKLVATGFLHPIHRHAEEIVIPAAQWRTLHFNPDFTEAHGRNISYRGVAVAVATS